MTSLSFTLLPYTRRWSFCVQGVINRRDFTSVVTRDVAPPRPKFTRRPSFVTLNRCRMIAVALCYLLLTFIRTLDPRVTFYFVASRTASRKKVSQAYPLFPLLTTLIGKCPDFRVHVLGCKCNSQGRSRTFWILRIKSCM